MLVINKHSHEWLILRKELYNQIELARAALEIVGTPEDSSNALRGEISMCRKLIKLVEGETGIVLDDTPDPLIF